MKRKLVVTRTTYKKNIRKEKTEKRKMENRERKTSNMINLKGESG